MIAQSLGEFILAAPAHEQANLMADSLATLGQHDATSVRWIDGAQYRWVLLSVDD
jgi:hypothetical protein